MPIRLSYLWETRFFHWFFFIVVVLKLWSGFYISVPHPLWGFSGMYSARILHAILTPVLAALLTFRLYYSLLSGDWRRLLLWRRSHLSQLRPWLRYIFFLDSKPPAPDETYHVGLRLLLTSIFLTMPLFFITGLIMLNLPFFRWLTIFCGGLSSARTLHFLATVFLTSFVAMHVYLALTTDLKRLKAMFGWQPKIADAGKERNDADKSDSAGGAGKPDYVR
ncbi:MAG: cytochrome b/b6 domain-containing protein [Dethiobacter sp.]|jgi:Ni/Fe-hydrogenase 1 B-type cytochrome subunit|nr:cytochrome b/b6 domain-containing protein [Dethiobacter sp.]MBS3900684.1 cytochrome b/b6 domain-containing protein [Dethiobacter sp.]MBS3989278.1 cytochrome b/b6 domain-containing protein [Dethiobacter sp.]